MKQSVIKEMATNELEEHLTDQKVRLEKMKINHTVSPLENPKQIIGIGFFVVVFSIVC